MDRRGRAGRDSRGYGAGDTHSSLRSSRSEFGVEVLQRTREARPARDGRRRSNWHQLKIATRERLGYRMGAGPSVTISCSV